MSGNFRNIIENSKVDNVFYEYRKIFKKHGDEYAFFAYVFYFFYSTQRDQKQNFEQKSGIEKISCSINSEKRKKLHVTHKNHWSLQADKKIERTVSKFNLDYNDRHFFYENNQNRDILLILFDFDLCIKIFTKTIASILWSVWFLLKALPLKRRLGSLNLPPFPRIRFVIQLYRYEIYKIHAEKFLKSNYYKEVFFSCYYTLRSMAICSPAKNLGLTTINLQHGVQGPKHPAFNFSSFRTLKLPAYVPDIFYCYYLAVDHNLKHPELKIVHQGKKEKLIKQKDVKNILITMQPSFEFGSTFQTVFYELAKRGYSIYFKLHPRSNPQKEAIENLCSNDGLEILPVDIPIHVALRDIDLHITGFSSSAIDAWELGIKTYFLDEKARGLFASLMSKNSAEFCTSAQELNEKFNHYD